MVMVDSGLRTWDASERGTQSSRQVLEELIETSRAKASPLDVQASFVEQPDGRGELVVEIENHGPEIGSEAEPSLTLIRFNARYVHSQGRWRVLRDVISSSSQPIGRLEAGERRIIRTGVFIGERWERAWPGVVAMVERRAAPGEMSWEALQSDLAEWEPLGTPTPLPTATASPTPTPWPTPTPFATLPWDVIRQASTTDNPYYVTTRLGRETDWRLATPEFYSATIFAFRDSSAPSLSGDLPAQVPIADLQDLGPVHGLAYDRERQLLFAGARQEGRSPPANRFGTIYRIDLMDGRIQPLLRLPAEPAGPTPRPYETVWDAGIGDLEIDEASGHLFAVNLQDRRIYRIDSLSGRVVDSFANGGSPTPGDPNFRPFGLAWHAGWLYHALVWSPPNRPAAAPIGQVYRSRADGSEMTRVAEFDMDYPRPQIWQSWGPDNFFSPLIADLEILEDETMLIGIRPRYFHGSSGGDLLRALPAGPDRWQVETAPEHYEDDFGGGEDLTGSLALEPDGRRVVSSARLFGLRGGCNFARVAVWLEHAMGRREGPRTGMSYLSVDDCEGSVAGGDIERFDLPARPSPSPSPIATATSTPSSTPSTTPTIYTTLIPGHRPWNPLYLPFLIRNECLRSVALDILLVVDTSTSMREPTSQGRSKLEAVQESLLGFIDGIADNLEPEPKGARDRLGILAFNQGVTTLAPLSPDLDALRAGIGRLPAHVKAGTHMDLALAAGARALRSDQGAAPVLRHSVLILLTDGLHSGPAPRDAVEAEAEAAKASGIEIYTVGVGDADGQAQAGRIDAELLMRIASRPEAFVNTPDAEALGSIFHNLALELDCRGAGLRARPETTHP